MYTFRNRALRSASTDASSVSRGRRKDGRDMGGGEGDRVGCRCGSRDFAAGKGPILVVGGLVSPSESETGSSASEAEDDEEDESDEDEADEEDETASTCISFWIAAGGCWTSSSELESSSDDGAEYEACLLLRLRGRLVGVMTVWADMMMSLSGFFGLRSGERGKKSSLIGGSVDTGRTCRTTPLRTFPLSVFHAFHFTAFGGGTLSAHPRLCVYVSQFHRLNYSASP